MVQIQQKVTRIIYKTPIVRKNNNNDNSSNFRQKKNLFFLRFLSKPNLDSL
jgi:hypothetical protein